MVVRMFILLTFPNGDDKKKDDREKFEQLFEKYRKLMLYKAYGILNDYALSEDAVSEAFIRIYRNLNKIDDIASSRTASFLVTIVKNTALTILEKQKKYVTQESDIEPESVDNETEDTVLSGMISSDMLKLVDSLKEDLRAPFLLKYAHGLSHKEIASLLSISENNVTVRIHRAKNKLTEMFRKAGYGDGE
jgi:RNA polymerase sigma-70 factor (ECF subfamily)